MRTVSGVPVGREEGRASKGHRTPCAKAGDTNAMGLGAWNESLLEHQVSWKVKIRSDKKVLR